ncbi:hypothetical protein [Rhodoferax aquaticus]|nr:hypothetical protein [Rhodoferax aquaticus]
MMVLLPLRALAADLMALDMATSQAHTTKIVATPALSTGASSHFSSQSVDAAHHDCVDQSAPALVQSAEQADASSGDTTHCGTCSSCQVCHSLALGTAAVLAPVVAFGHSAPQSTYWALHSVTAAPSLKPPIS